MEFDKCKTCNLSSYQDVKRKLLDCSGFDSVICCDGNFVFRAFKQQIGDNLFFASNVLYSNSDKKKIRCSGQKKAEFNDLVETLIVKSEIPIKYKNCKYSSFKPIVPDYPKNLDYLKKALNENNRIIFVYGGNGTGKSSLACAAGNHYLSVGKIVKYNHTSELQSFWRAGTHSYGYDAKEFDDKKQAIYTADLVIIDELGFRCDDFTAQDQALAIYNILEHASGKIIITSNWTFEKIIENWGADWGNKIVSRLMNGVRIPFVGKPYKEG
jgi:DNA replication protein DnaC